MMKPSLQNIHGTAISISGDGVLIIGKSGSGKSDLALRLIDRGALLVSDDRVIIDNAGSQPLLRTAPNVAGLIEVRGLGIVQVAYVTCAPLKLVVDLDGVVPRFLDQLQQQDIAGIDIPHIALAAFESSAAIKVEYALKTLVDQTVA
jgi:HPr kinase/phosphorylase